MRRLEGGSWQDVTREQRARIRARAKEILRRDHHGRLMLITGALAAGVVGILAALLRDAIGPIGLGCMAGVVGALLGFVYARSYAPAGRKAMCECGIPVCIRCGYDLRAIKGERCPECGAARHHPPNDADAAR